MNKKIIVITISILIVVFIFIQFNKDIISSYILNKLSKWTESSVTTESVEISYSEEKIIFNGLKILNKPNFNDKKLDLFMDGIETLREKSAWTKDDLPIDPEVRMGGSWEIYTPILKSVSVGANLKF